MTQEVEDELDSVIFRNLKQCFINFHIYNISEEKRIDINGIYMQKFLLSTFPLGISAESEEQWIDLRSTPWICSKIQKFLKNISHSRSDLKYDMDWLANPWITSVKERSPFTGDLSSKLLANGHCSSACKEDAVSEANCADEVMHPLASCQDKDLKLKTAIALLPMV